MKLSNNLNTSLGKAEKVSRAHLPSSKMRSNRVQYGNKSSCILCLQHSEKKKAKSHYPVMCKAALLETLDTSPSTSGQQHASPVDFIPVTLSFSGRPSLFDSNGRLLLKNLSLAELTEWCTSIGERNPLRRATQLWRHMYGPQGEFPTTLDVPEPSSAQFSNAFRALAEKSSSLSGGLRRRSVARAGDGTIKMICDLISGEGTASGTVETVLIPMVSKRGGAMRYTVCVSSQVGCAMNCQFCYTGRMGLLGNLSTAQIVGQVIEARRLLAETDQSAPPISNLVFMGMGEPLNNYDAVMTAVEILATGLRMARSKIIVSTVGLVPELIRFVRSGAAKLAVSLHATTDEVRDWIVPVNRRYPLDLLLGTLRELFPVATCKGDDFVVFEYVMLGGVNDSEADARRLADLTSEIYCMINLIVFNPHEGTVFKQSSQEDVLRFRRIVVESGKICTIRASKGDDQMAACGQLGDLTGVGKRVPVSKPPEALLAV